MYIKRHTQEFLEAQCKITNKTKKNPGNDYNA
jgi:hypothetical protein